MLVGLAVGVPVRVGVADAVADGVVVAVVVAVGDGTGAALPPVAAEAASSAATDATPAPSHVATRAWFRTSNLSRSIVEGWAVVSIYASCKLHRSLPLSSTP